MKMRIVSVSVGTLGLAVVGLVLLAGRVQGQANAPADSATAEAPSAPSLIADNTAPIIPPALPPAPTTVSAAQSAPASPQPAASPVAVPVAPSLPADIKLSKGATDIARFAQGGITEDVMLAYIGNSKWKFSLGSDQIVYLNDLGVSGSVVKAMIQRDSELDAMSQAYTASLAAAQQQAQPANPYPYPTAPTDYPENPPAPPMDDTSAYSPPPDPGYVPTDDADYFYSSLAPYGSWVYVAGCGFCWQPTVCVINHEWRPYCDRGRWLFSDCGWYWQSDYTWGWAAFHYGRWFEDAHHGWCWSPDHVWGPAWVSWRASHDNCGWAPLPPSAHYEPGRGFTYAHHPVGAGFEFGLRANQYTYIPIARMTDYSPARYAATSWEADQIHNHTTVITAVSEQNHHIFARGIDPNQVAALAGTTVRHAEVHTVPHNGLQPVQPDRLGKSGGSLVIYRSELPAPTHVSKMGNGVMPASRPAGSTPRNFGQPRTSISTAAPQDVRLAANANASHEAYPPGSLILRGNGEPASRALPNMDLSYLKQQTPTVSQPIAEANNSGTYNYSQRTWQPAQPMRPVRSQSEYSVVNGFARPNTPMHITQLNAPSFSAPSQNSGPSVYVMHGSYTAAQHFSGGSSSPYTVYSSSTPAPAHSGHNEGNNSYAIPGSFTASEHLNASSTQARGTDFSSPRHSHEQQPAQAESHPHFESHAESHTESHAATYSAPAPASHSSSSSSSSSGSSSSGRR
ncbi:MAG TPA: DUF6600 domain-containing protein [Verrucomicrobiae bacterium]|nr:DUF6600 domain-containing protein [Verrucomicrobiae bacterium]